MEEAEARRHSLVLVLPPRQRQEARALMRVRGAPLQVIGPTAVFSFTSRELSQFERSRSQERVALAPRVFAPKAGALGRKPAGLSDERFLGVTNLSAHQAARSFGDSHPVVARWRAVNKTVRKRSAPSRRQPFRYSGAELPVASMTA